MSMKAKQLPTATSGGDLPSAKELGVRLGAETLAGFSASISRNFETQAHAEYRARMAKA